MKINVERGYQWKFGYIQLRKIEVPKIKAWTPASDMLLALPKVTDYRLEVQEFVAGFPPDAKDRTPESIRRHVDRLYHSKSARVQPYSWNGTSPKQLLAKVNKRGDGVVFFRARRGSVRRKIQREFDAKMLKARREADEHNRYFAAIREEKYAFLMAVREPLYFVYDFESDTLICSREPHEYEVEKIKLIK